MEKLPQFYKERLRDVALLIIIAMALIYAAGHEEVDCKTKAEFLGNYAVCDADGHVSVFPRDGMALDIPGAQNSRPYLKNQGEVLVVSNRENGQCGTFFIVDNEILFQSEDIEGAYKVANVRAYEKDGEKNLIVEYLDYYYGALALMRVDSKTNNPQVSQFISGVPSVGPNDDIECA